MRNATVAMLLAFLLAGSALAQEPSEFELNVPVSEDSTAAYTVGIHSGARSATGPFDLDGDTKYELLVTDYTGGGRVHVIENAGPDTWELVYTTPWLENTGNTENARIAMGGDMDDDGAGEIIVPCGWGLTEGAGKDIVPTEGFCFWEFTGTDDDYGTEPAAIYAYNGNTPDRSRHEVLEIVDVDGDGFQEMLFANNGADNQFDNWYVVSVTGDIGSGFEAFNDELRLSSRSDDFDPVTRGGGSPYGIVSADLDGDGMMEISMGSWNSFNFTNAAVTGPDTYVAPAEGDPNINVQASPLDNVALFGGVAVDINGDGDDEVYYPRFGSANETVTVINYEAGEDPLQITMDQVGFDVISGLSSLGIAAGDWDGDGVPELYGGSAGDMLVNVAKYVGGDVEDPASYEVLQLETAMPDDTLGYNTVITTDSTGTTTKTFTGKPFVPKLSYLGDPDMDGNVELAVALQVPLDTVTTTERVWNPDSADFDETVTAKAVSGKRVFMRVLSANGVAVDVVDERIVLPGDYKLDANYPNPFNPTTTISFTLPLDKTVSVRVYDINGRLVTSLVDGQHLTKGTHQVMWDATDASGSRVASGTYIYSLEYGNFRQTRKMVLLK